MDVRVFKLRFGFHEGADTLSAQHLAHHSTIFHHADCLEVWAKSPLSGLFRPRAVETKSCFLAAMSTLSHGSKLPFQRSKRKLRA